MYLFGICIIYDLVIKQPQLTYVCGPAMTFLHGSSAGKDEPVAASMHIRPKDPKAYVTPAPCDYSPDKAEAKVVETSPSFSFGIKVENGRASDAPGKYCCCCVPYALLPSSFLEMFHSTSYPAGSLTASDSSVHALAAPGIW